MSLAISSWVFDKAVYNPGDLITLTVSYTSTDVLPANALTHAVTVMLSDATGTATQASDASASFPDFTTETPSGVPEPVTVTVTDSRVPSGVWTLVSDSFTGTVSPFTGTAVLTSTA